MRLKKASPIPTSASPARLFALIACFLAWPAHTADMDWFEQHPGSTPTVDTKPVIEIYVTLSDKVALGQTDKGERYIVPITGGYFKGKGIQGKVVPGGADWQLVRQDGVKEIVARYSLRTDDGKVIMVDNRGIARPAAQGGYRLTAPKFHAPQGRHEWLNQSLFVGTITSIKKPRAVVIRAYQLK